MNITSLIKKALQKQYEVEILEERPEDFFDDLAEIVSELEDQEKKDLNIETESKEKEIFAWPV